MRFLLACCVLLSAAQIRAAKVIVFGDSLSVESAFIFRFIEPGGVLWHERIADELGLDRAFRQGFLSQTGTNQAVAGDVVSGLADQVTNFRNNHSWQSGDLCLLWIGGNDVRGYTPGLDLPTDMEALASAIGDQIRSLFQSDGVDRFLVPNLPDIGAIPESQGNPTQAADRTTVTIAFNAALKAELNALTAELSGIEIEQLDIFNLFDQMLINPGDYGFSNVTDAFTSASGSPDPATYAFYDDIHPTARSHELVAGAARIIINTTILFEIIAQSIETDLSLRQTWLGDPDITYSIYSGSDLNSLSEAASYSGSPAHTAVIPAPGPDSGFYQTRTSQ